jgi:hypothetical protein
MSLIFYIPSLLETAADGVLLTYLLKELSPSWGAANCAAPQELPTSSWNSKVRYHSSIVIHYMFDWGWGGGGYEGSITCYVGLYFSVILCMNNILLVPRLQFVYKFCILFYNMFTFVMGIITFCFANTFPCIGQCLQCKFYTATHPDTTPSKRDQSTEKTERKHAQRRPHVK